MYASQSMFVYAVYLITSNVSAASPASSKTMSGKWNRAEAQPRVGVWNTLRATAAAALVRVMVVKAGEVGESRAAVQP